MVAGSLDALAGEAFELVTANLLRSELLSLLPALVERLTGDGTAILSGLLASDLRVVREPLAALGLRIEAERSRSDAPSTHSRPLR